MNRLVCSTLVTAALGVGLGVAAPAKADIAPPRDYVEQCTLERVQGEGDSCVECRGSFQDREACATEWAPQGYTKACNTRGASVWTEIWCASGEGSADAPSVGDGPGPPEEGAAAVPGDAPADGAAEAGDGVAEAAPDDGSASASEADEGASDGEEAQETAPAEPPARSRGCSAAAGSSPWLWAIGFAGLAVRRRRR